MKDEQPLHRLSVPGADVVGCVEGAHPGQIASQFDEQRNSLGGAGGVMERRYAEIVALSRVTERINSGIALDDILNYVYEEFRPLIPYDRIGFSTITDDGKAVRATWSRSAAETMRIQTGYTASLEGSSLQQVIETGRPRILNDLVQHLAEHPRSESTRLLIAEGMRSSLTCPLVAMGKPIGFMFFTSMQPGMYRDVHVELFMQIAGQLATTVEKGRIHKELLGLLEQKNRFLGIVAHDLRNPLAIFRGFLGMLLGGAMGEVPQRQRVYLERMRVTSEYMLSLVNDLLDVNTHESGKLALEMSPVEVGRFLEDMVDGEMPLAEAKGLSLILETLPELPLVEFDRNRISQVMNNLISNAIKFSSPGSVIRVRAGVEDDGVWIAVADEGQGIPEDELGQTFNEFARTSVRPTAGERCTGLGLAIVKRLVEAHGGRVRVESSYGVGSTFTFVLPLRQ